MARARPAVVLEQGRFVGTWDPEEEVMLELTVPLSADTEFFRIGWSLKGLRRTGWIAMSTGHAEWSRRELDQAAAHILTLLQECASVVRGGDPASRR